MSDVLPFTQLCEQHQLQPDPRQVRLRVLKAGRRLELWQGASCLADIPVIIGRAATGHKQEEGDLRTPEGRYYICYRNQESRFHRFLGISYPGVEDARRALANGLIDREQHTAICTAVERGECPDWYTPLGGEVGIHGGGIDRPGTRGCIAMDDPWIEVLWDATCLGTPVVIEP